MRRELTVTVDAGRALDYRSAAPELAPAGELRASRPLRFELVHGGFRGTVQLDGSPEDCDRDVACHLTALRDASRANPAWKIRIEIEPDGGVVTLEAGSFGDDADEIEHLLRWIAPAPTPAPPAADAEHGRLYLSVQLPEDAHRHFIDLVTRQLPDGWVAPTTDSALDAVAIGFELDGDPAHTAQLISILRYAWLSEGSLAPCLIELEGTPAQVRRIEDLHGWTELEQALLDPDPDPDPGAEPVFRIETDAIERRELARTEPVPALAGALLTWVDERGRILGLDGDGVVWDLAARVEAELASVRYLRRRDGSWCMRSSRAAIEVPAAPGAERRAHRMAGGWLLFTDSRGPESRVRMLDERGLFDGPLLHNPRALVCAPGSRFAYAVGDVGGHAALVTIDLSNLQWDHCTPWPAASEITDLVPGAAGRLIGVASVAGAGALYVIGGSPTAVERTLYLPCRAPAIIRADRGSVWLTGVSPGRGPARSDLIHVDLEASTASVVTAGITSEGWGELHAVRHGDGWLLAYAACGVFELGRDAEPVFALDPGEVITSVHREFPFAVFTSGPGGARLFIAAGSRVIALPSPGQLPIFRRTAGPAAPDHPG